MKEFSNKVVIITSRSSGIGLFIAQKFDAAGAKLGWAGQVRHSALNRSEDRE